MRTLAWIVRKDLLRFVADRPGALLTFALPVVLATLLSVMLEPALGPLEVELLVVDHDGSPGTAALLETLDARASVELERVDEAEARRRLAQGNAPVALVLPAGTGAALSAGGLAEAEPPAVALLYDPSRGAEVDLVAGLLLEATLARLLATLGDAAGAPALRAPLAIERRAVTGAVSSAPFDIHAHLFAGMLSMFVLFMAQEQARHLVAERRDGTLLRLRLSGAPRWQILAGTGLSTALLALVLSAIVYGAGALCFGIAVRGSGVGFVLVLAGQALFAGGFALLLAGLARSERQLVSVGTAAVLLLSFAGGSWLPAFLLPEWLGQLGHALPTWWANRGLAAMTWRGHGVGHAWLPAAALLGLGALCAGLGVLRFAWATRRHT